MSSGTASPDPVAAIDFLRQDVMGNLPFLKMRSAYPDHAHLRFCDDRHATTYVSFSWPADPPTFPDPRVKVSLTTDLLGQKMRAAMPTTLEDVLPYFANGDARLFTIAEDLAPVAGCLTYPNFEHVHEIGVLYTAPGYRHRGFEIARR